MGKYGEIWGSDMKELGQFIKCIESLLVFGPDVVSIIVKMEFLGHG